MDTVENRDPRTYKIEDVQLLSVGKYTGSNGATHEWTERDIDEVVENHAHGVTRPSVLITQDGEHGSKPVALPGGASLGFISDLTRRGKSLVATFAGLPESIYKLIKSGSLSLRSIEGRIGYQKNGENVGRVLTGVLLFGDGIPAVSGLEEIAAMYESPTSGESFAFAVNSVAAVDEANTKPLPIDAGRSVEKKPKERTVENQITLTAMELQAFADERAELKVLRGTLAESATKRTEAEAKAAASDAQVVKLTADLNAYKAKDMQHERDTAVKAADELVKAGKLKPAQRDATIERIVELKGDERDEYVVRLNTLPSVFGEKVGETTDGGGAEKDIFAEAEAKIAQYQTANPGKSFAEARKAVMGG